MFHMKANIMKIRFKEWDYSSDNRTGDGSQHIRLDPGVHKSKTEKSFISFNNMGSECYIQR